MTDGDYLTLRRAEILDGTIEWSCALTSGDHDDFYNQYVLPLRELKRRGLFPTLHEITAAIDGNTPIVGLQVDGGINYDARKDGP